MSDQSSPSRPPYPLAVLAAKVVTAFAGVVMVGMATLASVCLWRLGHPPVPTSTAAGLIALATSGAALVAVGRVVGRRRRPPPAA